MERHRIHEIFSEEMLMKIEAITKNPKLTDNNQKVKELLFLLKDLGFTEIGPGTNRLCVRHVDYVYKIALDSYGVRDNWTEFNVSPKLQPYVTKTYECNGLIAVAEYATIMTKQEFMDSKYHIRAILQEITEDWLICDMGTISKNWLNFAYRDDGSLVVIDYGYTYPLDRKIMHCKKCGGMLKWDPDFSSLNCTRCGKRHDPIEIRDRMWKDESTFVPKTKEEMDEYLVIEV